MRFFYFTQNQNVDAIQKLSLMTNLKKRGGDAVFWGVSVIFSLRSEMW